MKGSETSAIRNDHRFSLADFTLHFAAEEPVLQSRIDYLLHNHGIAGAAFDTPHGTVRLVVDEFRDEKEPVLESAQSGPNEWVWRVSAESARWLVESFYYRVLSPILSKTMALLQVTRLHGALLHHDSVGSVLIVGGRCAGKSTAAAAWLASGGSICTDDTVFIRCQGGRILSSGLQRDLHIDPSNVLRLPELERLDRSEEYLPGTNRLSYDWCARFPHRRIRKLGAPEHILLSSFHGDAVTEFERLQDSVKGDAVEQIIRAEPENQSVCPGTLDIVRHQLRQASWWRVVWGEDVWTQGRHFAVIQRRLGGPRRSPVQRVGVE